PRSLRSRSPRWTSRSPSSATSDSTPPRRSVAWPACSTGRPSTAAASRSSGTASGSTRRRRAAGTGSTCVSSRRFRRAAGCVSRRASSRRRPTRGFRDGAASRVLRPHRAAAPRPSRGVAPTRARRGARGTARCRRGVCAVLSVALLGVAVAGIVWWSERTIRGDALFHLARIRKLDALATLHSLHTVDEFKDGGLHPGYAFPLWHAAMALVARLADVDP